MTAGTATPRGVLVYYSRIARAWTDAEAAEEIAELREMRASWAILCAEATASDGHGWVADHRVLAANAAHLRAAGIRVAVYSLPSERAWLDPEATADRLADAGIACGAELWVPDVEEQARGKGVQVRLFRRRLTERASVRVGIMVTFYGKIPRTPPKPRPADGLFPWAEIVGWGSCGYQLYKTAEHDELVDARMADAAHHWGPDVVPHFATYLGDADRLRGDFDRTCVRDGVVFVVAVAIWQKSTTNRAERLALAEIAMRLEDAARTHEPTQRLRP